jgi:hypothetical protein
LSLKAGWDNVAEVPLGQPTKYKVDDLIAKKTYKFRIRAVNKIGSSEPGLFGKPVLAKDPWGTFILEHKKRAYLFSVRDINFYIPFQMNHLNQRVWNSWIGTKTTQTSNGKSLTTMAVHQSLDTSLNTR